MQAVNDTVQSRKCVAAIILTYSFWQRGFEFIGFVYFKMERRVAWASGHRPTVAALGGAIA
jgi:hypothetical protein